MATKHVTHLIDDLDGSVLEDGAGKTVSFSVDGRAYEIDLSKDNASTSRRVRPVRECRSRDSLWEQRPWRSHFWTPP